MNYDKDSIKVLSDIEHIQTRSGMYIGDADTPKHLLSEIIDNAIDEYQSGFSCLTEIVVNYSDNSYEVRDYGRGIPHGTKLIDNGEEIEVIELLCTKSNSGGKFEGKNYTISAGLHGIGLTLVNALSHELTIESYRDGKCVRLNAIDSNIVNILRFDTTEVNGTRVKFIPSKKYFSSNMISEEEIINRCKILNAFGYKTTLVIDNKKVEDVESYTTTDILPKYDKLYSNFKFECEIEDEKVLTEFNYNNGTRYSSIGFTNLIYNRMGGTHVKLLRKCICDAWVVICNNHKEDLTIKLMYDDCLIGLDTLVAVFLKEVSFSSQTKEKLTVNNDYLSKLFEELKNKFIDYMENNDTLRTFLIKRFEEYRISQNKLMSQKEITSLVKLNNSTDGKIKRRSVVTNLIECTTTSVEGSELYIVEGNSAAGPLARARNPRLQAVLPLRGKIKNITYMSIEEALKSREVLNIVNAIGCGVGDNSDPSKSRYEKIIIETDADCDGYHIASLILSCLVNLIPNLVKAGKVYILESPLYGYNLPGVKERFYTSDLSEVPDNCINFTRYKGLGEMNDEEFRDSCLVEGKRKLYRVIYPDDLEAFNRILGSTAGRKELLNDLNLFQYCV